MQPHNLSAHLTTAEACEILAKDRATITRWVEAGKLTPAHKLPGRTGAFLFSRADVEKLAAELAAADKASA